MPPGRVLTSKIERGHAAESDTARIGGAGGFWGDRVLEPVELLKHEKLDYVMFDYLAELTLSIMAKQRARNSETGWATDLVDWLSQGGLTELQAQGVKLVTNAGGANPESCARAVLEIARNNGWNNCKIAVVTGDDLLARLDFLFADGHHLSHMETEELLSETEATIIASNAYLGAGPIGAALEAGADLVITGRVADASMLVGCMLHKSGWAANAVELGLSRTEKIADWAPEGVISPLDILAQWTVAGHLIECGSQVCGGNSSDWQTIPDLDDLALPVAEVGADGSVVITRALRGGGRVDRRIVAEQLIYEIGDPAAYITPDVVVDLRQVTLSDESHERVTVMGARGLSQPEDLKISGAVEAGWFAASSLLVSGPDSRARATLCDETLRGRLDCCEDLEIHSELVGTGITLPPGFAIQMVNREDPPEVLIRWAATSRDREEVIRFSREVAPLVLTGPGGVCGYGARARPRRQLRHWPSLLPRELVEPQVKVEILTVADLLRSTDRLEFIRSRTRRFVARLQVELEEREWTRPIARRIYGSDGENTKKREEEVAG